MRHARLSGHCCGTHAALPHTLRRPSAPASALPCPPARQSHGVAPHPPRPCPPARPPPSAQASPPRPAPAARAAGLRAPGARAAPLHTATAPYSPCSSPLPNLTQVPRANLPKRSWDKNKKNKTAAFSGDHGRHRVGCDAWVCGVCLPPGRARAPQRLCASLICRARACCGVQFKEIRTFQQLMLADGFGASCCGGCSRCAWGGGRGCGR